MTLTRPPRAVLFDLDGTLVDTVGTRVSAWLEVFPRFGIRPDPAFVGTLMGSDGKLVAREAAASVGRALEPGVDAEIDRLAGERFGELNRDPRPLPGAAEVLRWLDTSGIPWAIATSSRKEEAIASVRALDVEAMPRVIDGSDVEHAKPAPDLLLKAASELGIDPAEMWYVGDAIWDMRAASAAGMVAVGVSTGATPEADLRAAGAAVAVAGLRELLEILPVEQPEDRGHPSPA